MIDFRKIEDVNDDTAEELVDSLVSCSYCNEPFKECDTLIPGVGVIVGETDVVRYAGKYWHSGCVEDYRRTL
jgi:hypothetical protein